MLLEADHAVTHKKEVKKWNLFYRFSGFLFSSVFALFEKSAYCFTGGKQLWDCAFLIVSRLL